MGAVCDGLGGHDLLRASIAGGFIPPTETTGTLRRFQYAKMVGLVSVCRCVERRGESRPEKKTKIKCCWVTVVVGFRSE